MIMKNTRIKVWVMIAGLALPSMISMGCSSNRIGREFYDAAVGGATTAVGNTILGALTRFLDDTGANG